MRRRLGWWLLRAVLRPAVPPPTPTRVQAAIKPMWVSAAHGPHLLQTTAMVDLASDRITRPKLARLAATIGRQGQADLEQLQGWLADRGLSPYDPQLDPDRSRETDLSRLSRVHGARFDVAF